MDKHTLGSLRWGKYKLVAPLLGAMALMLIGGSLRANAASVRIRQRFDADWRFQLEAADSGQDGLPVTNWRWKPAPEGTRGDIAELPQDLDSGAWQPATVGQDVFQGRVGFAWFQAKLAPATRAGSARFLHFESVDDNAVVFLNGKKLGRHEGWDDSFEVLVGSAWNARGPNVVTVLVENTAGVGGVMKPVTLEFGAEGDDIPPCARPNYDDHAWRVVHLPQDYVVEGKFDPHVSAGHASLPVTPAWYRKTFALPASYRGKAVWLDFDGVYRDAKIWLNGHWIGEYKSGYMSFRCDIAPYAHFGGKNVLAVHVDPRHFEGWWYEGGGIYRHVWLNAADPLHVAPWGTVVTTTVHGLDPTGKTPPDSAAQTSADLTIKTTLDNQAKQARTATVVSEIFGPDGKVIATVKTPQTIPAGKSVEVAQTASVPAARLWSLKTPNLYRLHTTVQESRGKTLDDADTPFGIRTIYFDADRGFFLNGVPVKLQGTCNHQDFAGVGIGMPDSLLEWRIKKLKEMGGNAYRCSHNPVAAELLDDCDRLGMLVMDENRHLGDTYNAKTPLGTSYSDLSDLKALITRDRNHPSVIMWSLCNEELLQGTNEGKRIFSAMMDVVHSLDTTRPISCAMNGGWGHGITLVEDLQGFNYGERDYDSFHKSHPTMPLYGSETSSALSMRGIYVTDKNLGYVSAYDLNRPPWGATAEDAWRPLAERPFMAGGFVWTGFDYKGEPTPYDWPSISSYFGILDLCGFPKDNFWYYQAWWGDKPVVHLLPHWNWPGKEGQNIDVWCYANCDRVELFLNGTSLGGQEMPRYGHVAWKVPYRPGAIEARGYQNGAVVATDMVLTSGPPALLRLRTDRKTLTADGEDVTMIAVEVLDSKGQVVPTADNLVTFQVSGAAHIAGVGNGDETSHEPDVASQRHAFNGRCMVILQANESPGPAEITATAPGLQSATLTLRVEKAPMPH